MPPPPSVPAAPDRQPAGVDKLLHIRLRIARPRLTAPHPRRQLRATPMASKNGEGSGLALEQAAPLATPQNPARSSLPTRVSPSFRKRAKNWCWQTLGGQTENCSAKLPVPRPCSSFFPQKVRRCGSSTIVARSSQATPKPTIAERFGTRRSPRSWPPPAIRAGVRPACRPPGRRRPWDRRILWAKPSGHGRRPR